MRVTKGMLVRAEIVIAQYNRDLGISRTALENQEFARRLLREALGGAPIPWAPEDRGYQQTIEQLTERLVRAKRALRRTRDYLRRHENPDRAWLYQILRTDFDEVSHVVDREAVANRTRDVPSASDAQSEGPDLPARRA